MEEMANGVQSASASGLWSKIRRNYAKPDAPARKRPTNLSFDVDEVPSVPLSLALASQHVLAMSVGWIYVIVAIDAMGGTASQAQSLLRLSMIASGVTTILQARRGLAGSGYLCPASCSLTYLAPSILAGRLGGLPLLFGMTTLNGVFTAVLSRFLRKLRSLFPPDVTGLIVSIVGIQLVALGVPRLLGRTPGHPDASTSGTLVGILTLVAMIAPSIWSRGKLKFFPILIGLIVGHIAALTTGVLSWSSVRVAWAQPVISVPHRVAGGLSFRAALLVPFLVIGIAAALKTVGDLTLCQKMNDADWKRTDMESVSGGVMANSLGTIFSGLIGGVAQNNASACLGVEIATGATSRSIAVPAGLIVIALAFFPGLASTFAIMPVPVMGALLIYSTCFLMLGGLQVMTSRMLDARRIFAIGIALVFGISVEVAPELYRNVPELIRPIFASSTALATVIAVVLSMVFRIGLARNGRLELASGRDNLDEISRFMDELGSAWGMRRDVVSRATDAIYEFVTNAGELQLRSLDLQVEAEFDELSLDVEIEYDGVPLKITNRMPTMEELAGGEGVATLSQYLISQSADQVKVKQRNGRSVVRLHFEH
jgi:NCS2 family nucleobase:cation symporter-2